MDIVTYGALNKKVGEKLSSNQGTQNAGKMLGINNEGEIQPIQVLGGNVSVTETLESGEDYSMVIEEGEPTAVTSVAGKYGTVTLDAGDIEYDEQEVYNSGTVGKEVGDLKSQMSDVSDDIGTVLTHSKDSYGAVILPYALNAGTIYHVKTGSGILGWLKTQTSSNVDVDTWQNVPANSDFTFTASGDAVKIYIYYNAKSSFYIVQAGSIRDDADIDLEQIDGRFINQADFFKNAMGNSYNIFPIVAGHTYAICNHGSGILGQMSTLTASNQSVEQITRNTTQPGGMVVFTATANAAKVYCYYNSASAFTILDMGALASLSALVGLSLAYGYSNVSTYSVGDFCTNGYRLWQCTTAIDTAEEWTEGHWQLVPVVNAIKSITNNAVLAERIETPDYTISPVASGAYISEDMSIVGDDVWLFTQSASVGGQQDGYISMVSAQDYSVMTHQCTHNLGHCGATDYDPDNDRMIISGADNGAAQTPYTYIYHNVNVWKNESAVAYADQTVDRIDLSALASQYGPVSYLAVCWGPRTITGDKLVYLFGGNNWYLLLMGMGENQLDLGTYTAADSGRYNGTFKVLNYWTYDPHMPWEAYDSVTQGIKMHNGIVYTSNGHRAITVWEWIFKDDHVASVIQHRSPWIDNAGTHSTAQGQGLDFNNGQMIVAISSGYIATVQ